MSRNLRFSDVSRGYKNGSLTWNDVIDKPEPDSLVLFLQGIYMFKVNNKNRYYRKNGNSVLIQKRKSNKNKIIENWKRVLLLLFYFYYTLYIRVFIDISRSPWKTTFTEHCSLHILQSRKLNFDMAKSTVLTCTPSSSEKFPAIHKKYRLPTALLKMNSITGVFL